MGRKNENRRAWALGEPEIGIDAPVRKITPAVRRVLIQSLEHTIQAGAHQCSTLSAARILRGLKVAEAIEQVEQQELQAAARARLAELEQQAL